MDTTDDLEVGTWVRWNGSGSSRSPRWYTGMVIEVLEDTVRITDTEWLAISEVSKRRVEEVFYPGC